MTRGQTVDLDEVAHTSSRSTLFANLAVFVSGSLRVNTG